MLEGGGIKVLKDIQTRPRSLDSVQEVGEMGRRLKGREIKTEVSF